MADKEKKEPKKAIGDGRRIKKRVSKAPKETEPVIDITEEKTDPPPTDGAEQTGDQATGVSQPTEDVTEDNTDVISSPVPVSAQHVGSTQRPLSASSVQRPQSASSMHSYRSDISASERPTSVQSLRSEVMADDDMTPTVTPPASTPSQTKAYEYDHREFHNLDPKQYGIEFEEEELDYEPPVKDDTLPDLYRLMDTLEGGESDLETEVQPPSLFTRPEHVDNYKKISELRLQIEEEEIDAYVDDFEDTVKEDVLMIGSISLEEVQEEEKRLRDEHIQYQQQEAELARQRQEGILIKEESAKKRMAKNLKDKRRILAKKEEIAQQRERLLMARMHKAFKRAEDLLKGVLERRKGEVTTMYGDLTVAEGQFGGSKGRRWKVDWNKTPQPIQIKLKCLRGVKDKLPGGRYILMVSMYNRLGGHVMRWSKLKGQQWGGATLPITHDGNFYNAELKVDQSVFTVLPPKPSVKPGMVLVFELFLLRGAVVPTDRVIGWGCFPICDGEFDVIEGQYKTPFLRGEMDSMIDKHEKVEELMSSDIDHWLCNCYFEVVKLPRYLAGQKEYEVELQFSAGLLSFPDRVHGAEDTRDGDDPIPGSLVELNPDVKGSHVSIAGSSIDDEDEKPPRYQNDFNHEKLNSANLRSRRPMTTIGSHRLHKDNKVTAGDLSSDSSDFEEEDVYEKKSEDFLSVKGQPGMYYKRHMHNPVDMYQKKLFTLLPKTPMLTQRRRRKKLTHLEQLEEHTIAVRTAFTGMGRFQQKGWEKVSYVSRQFTTEVGLSEWRSREFWGMLMIFCVIFFIRLYIHYIAQWVLLQASTIPINKFDFLPYTVNLNYQPTLLQTREEMAVVMIGPLAIILVFVLLVIASWLSQLILGTFPDIGSKFVLGFGLQALLDVILILIVDCALLRFEDKGGDQPIADFTKLYWHFYRAEGSGLGGIFITVFLYGAVIFMAGAILYMYFLRLHNNGRMLDIYWRLHGKEDDFFIPYDLELSNQELSYIVKRAEQWRGEEGERRKVAIYDYVWEEENADEMIWDEDGQENQGKDGKREVTTHIGIHTLHLDGLRELYRHFLRLPDGAIVEIFGEMSVAGMDKDMKSALEQGNTKVENLMGSQYSLSKVRGRQTVVTQSGFRGDEGEGSQFFTAPTPVIDLPSPQPYIRPSSSGSVHEVRPPTTGSPSVEVGSASEKKKE